MQAMRWTSIIGALAAVALVAALAGCGGGEDAVPAGGGGGEAATAAGEAGLRTVLVFEGEPAPSSAGADLHATLEEPGPLPRGTVRATVLTDEDCAPDAEGISHCRNLVRLPSGRVLALRHPHDMAEVPCLAPEEEVLLRAAA